MRNILQQMLRHGGHATEHYSMEYCHDIHRCDVCLCGENGPGGGQSMNHQVNPVVKPYGSIEHTKHG